MNNNFLDKFNNHKMEFIPFNQQRKAAILIPVIHDKKSDELCLLFEVRNSSIAQGSEICFPGGMIEEGESGETAAIRETSEELCLSKDQITVTSPMFELSGPRGISVNSYLGTIENYKNTWSTDEVDHVFTLPISWFIENEPIISSAKLKTIPDTDFPYELIPNGKDYTFWDIHKKFYFYQTPEGIIWGLTAQIIYAFIKHVCD